MNSAQQSFDLSTPTGTARDCVQFAASESDYTVRPLSAVDARDNPLVAIVTDGHGEITVEVTGLRRRNSGTFPLLVTWELYLGGGAAVDASHILRRKTWLASEAAVRSGRLFSFRGGRFKQAFLAARVAPMVNGQRQEATLVCALDITIGPGQGSGFGVIVGSAVG